MDSVDLQNGTTDMEVVPIKKRNAGGDYPSYSIHYCFISFITRDSEMLSGKPKYTCCIDVPEDTIPHKMYEKIRKDFKFFRQSKFVPTFRDHKLNYWNHAGSMFLVKPYDVNSFFAIHTACFHYRPKEREELVTGLDNFNNRYDDEMEQKGCIEDPIIKFMLQVANAEYERFVPQEPSQAPWAVKRREEKKLEWIEAEKERERKKQKREDFDKLKQEAIDKICDETLNKTLMELNISKEDLIHWESIIRYMKKKCNSVENMVRDMFNKEWEIQENEERIEEGEKRLREKMDMNKFKNL